jgi:hypothetical protein
MACGFSVFWLPLSRVIGITKSNACADLTLVGELFTTRDWRISSLGWMYTLAAASIGTPHGRRSQLVGALSLHAPIVFPCSFV